VFEGPLGVQILPAASGVVKLLNLDEEKRLTLVDSVDEIADFFDVVIIDTGAGISDNVRYFNSAAQEVLVVTNPEPTALTDAYALMKVLSNECRIHRFKLIVNEVTTASQAKEVYRKLSTVSDQFFRQIGIDYLGFVYLDDHIPNSVRMQTPFLQAYPQAPASRCISVITDRLLSDPRMIGPSGNVQFFINRLLEQGDAS
jgi:flagellar biosynthesis protein FlhG